MGRTGGPAKIIWEDSAMRGGWTAYKDWELPQKIQAVSYGYILEETPSQVVLAQSLHDLDGKDGEYANTICIPRSAILKIRRLK